MTGTIQARTIQARTIQIDVVSDVACPWCAVGFGALTQAIQEIGDQAKFEVHFQPFELNPNLPVGGQDAMEHLTEKYGIDQAQMAKNQAQIRLRAKEVGFDFHPEGRKRIYNTFHAHRLLHWAALENGLEAQSRLKKELLISYFCLRDNMDLQTTLIAAVSRAGLNSDRAIEVLNQNEFDSEVRHMQHHYLDLGIHSVPSFILDGKYLMAGAQPTESFVSAFNQLLTKQD